MEYLELYYMFSQLHFNMLLVKTSSAESIRKRIKKLGIILSFFAEIEIHAVFVKICPI